jgi:hypothetical protein
LGYPRLPPKEPDDEVSLKCPDVTAYGACRRAKVKDIDIERWRSAHRPFDADTVAV